MSSQHISLSHSDAQSRAQDMNEQTQLSPTVLLLQGTKSRWHDRLIEGALIISMALYYLIGNGNYKPHLGFLASLHPLFALPFFILFLCLCWYRLPFAVALLPLTLPYYLLQKTVVGHANFSLVEITLWLCLAIASIQWLLQRKKWRFHVSWSIMRERSGPFLWAAGIFCLFALLSISQAYQPSNAERAVREEVIGPLLYLLLVLICLRTRQDLLRLLSALFGTGLFIVILGIIQYFFFKNSIGPDASNLQRITTVYGSANNIALLIDYTLPIGIAFILGSVSWRARLLVGLLCLPFLFVLLQSDSRGGALVAIPVASLFVLAFSIRNRKVLLFGSLACAIIGIGVVSLYHDRIYQSIVTGHESQHTINNVVVNQSTAAKRLYLWESAWHMIQDSPWLGYGMDNWLCHYSNDWTNECLYTKYQQEHHPATIVNGLYQPGPTHPKIPAYWIIIDPQTGAFTGLSDEPNLSHPHNIFLHVWVSIGVFGLCAFVAVLILFYWLFARLLWYLNRTETSERSYLRWATIAVGGAMVAGLVQGQVDSAFLEQDLSFCFWTLVASLLLVRLLAGMPWRVLISNASN
ncbi:O-antigen ligase family protein [Tengunoibacter tsumagoiensis]|uniref:O-antigen ligase-related domain-containing protein n=1 Tax=Tengunoibacter tsumagoiensis TaxID=2014871 RepID=A0A401ZZN3_9CHLR|nr:O-antigen ligase family protein [Tengunoibacter tsumagoiensis]GCE12252.1 hypothetical protein KTT_21110 [Tengunoibacter tsumagoiensis]